MHIFGREHCRGSLRGAVQCFTQKHQASTKFVGISMNILWAFHEHSRERVRGSVFAFCVLCACLRAFELADIEASHDKL